MKPTVSEITFNVEVTKFSQLNNFVVSEPTHVQNLPWKVAVGPNVEQNVKYVCVYFNCNNGSEDDSWTCQAEFELRIINHRNATQTEKHNFSHLFSSKDNFWGFPSFMEWAKVTDPEIGFLKDDIVTMEVKIKADPPSGIDFKVIYTTMFKY